MKKQTNIPQLRFPEFKSEWEQIKLGDVSKNISSGKSKGKENDGNYPLYGSTGIIGYLKSFDYSGEKILVARVGANAGSLYKVKGKYCVTDNTLILNLIDSIDADFTYNYLIKKNLNKLSFGSGQPLITGRQLKLFNLFFPSLPEQKRIASFFTVLDKKIAELRQKKTLLEQYKKGVMQKIFSQEVRFNNDNGKSFPNWDTRNLKSVFTRKTEKNLNNLYVNVLTNSATRGVVNQEDYFDKEIANQNNLLGYYIVDIDDFVYNPRISQSAPVGPLKRNHSVKGVMSPLYTVLICKIGNLDFFELYFETSFWHKYMRGIANYGVRYDRMNITNDGFEKLPLPFPVIEEQNKIAEFLKGIERKIINVSTQLEMTKKYKKGLLQKMFC